MVSDLGWELLKTRRLHSRLTMMFKITNGLVEVPQEYHPVPRPQNSARGHPRQFQLFQPTVDAFKYAFLPRTIPAWNALPQAVAEADSLDIFKRHMSRHLQFWPYASCTMYIVCTRSTAHSFPVLIYAPAFAVADHRGQDPASSVLSFEGRCYLLIQIQIQTLHWSVSLVYKVLETCYASLALGNCALFGYSVDRCLLTYLLSGITFGLSATIRRMSVGGLA